MIDSGLVDEVVVAAKWEPGLLVHDKLSPNVRVVRIKMHSLELPKRRPYQVIKYLEWRRALLALAAEIKPKIVVAHSLGPLAACVSVKRRLGARLLYDAHELETERNGLGGVAKILDKWVERRLIRHCDAVTVVCDSIADWYERRYHRGRPVVVRNVPEVKGGRPDPNPHLWRGRFGIPADHLIFIYQGGLFRGRRIEQLLRVFAQAKPNRHIVFMGYGEMRMEVENAAIQFPNIHYLPAVKPDEVLRHTAGADVGLVGVENICLSYYYSLPNKLFEFLLAGLPSLMPNFPEMVRLTAGSGCGWVVTEDDAAWLEAVNALTPEQIAAGKAAARKAGAELSWQREAARFNDVCRKLIS